GRLGAKPEIKTLANGRQLARFSIAITETYKNEQGDRISETHWHNLVAWGKTADIAARFLEKGKEIAIEGKLLTRQYLDKDGRKHHVSEVVVSDLLMIGPKSI